MRKEKSQVSPRNSWEVLDPARSPFSQEPFTRWSPLLSRTPFKTNCPSPCSRSPRPGSWHSEHQEQSSEQVTPVPCFPLHTKCFHLVQAGSRGPAGFWYGCFPYKQGQCFPPVEWSCVFWAPWELYREVAPRLFASFRVHCNAAWGSLPSSCAV